MEAIAGRPVSCRAGPKIIPKEKPRSAVQADLARTYGVSQATISRLARQPLSPKAWPSPSEVGAPNGNVARAPRLAS
jgi:hypothetical protein